MFSYSGLLVEPLSAVLQFFLVEDHRVEMHWQRSQAYVCVEPMKMVMQSPFESVLATSRTSLISQHLHLTSAAGIAAHLLD